ncbi:hypothetical protein [Novosphingobium pituita]|uniref:Uncharacterized protein n=1 Tax=Novosphingobium pituita TaxID=3056842 RepID=A0ABQ6P9A6_9SPHN|nr:hypothetical protein [Novosphingobium sp. IK01]GMM61492.1 hypothetical protein NUTIK01_22690 [Novosphingobium sp. IK01]
MQVQIADVSDLVDRFETLLDSHGVSIPKHGSTGADMLPLWRILGALKEGFSGTPDEMRRDYTAGLAVHDLAAKVLAVKDHQDFKTLIPHLEMLSKGAVHLTQEPPANSDVYNKLVEVYWATLLMASGTNVDLDHPKSSKGDNPDVIALERSQPARAYAFKTVRSAHTQNLYEHIIKGVDQIEKCPAPEGIVAFNLTPRLLDAGLWPEGGYFEDWRQPATHAQQKMKQMISDVVNENGQQSIDGIFKGKKAATSILCVAFIPTVAKNPGTGNPVVMPLKIAVLVELNKVRPPSDTMAEEIAKAHCVMQQQLG